MIYSMTGYGRHTVSILGKEIVIEVRTLNSKFLDINVKIPPAYKAKELEIRNITSSKIKRGKTEVTFNIKANDDEDAMLNTKALNSYLRSLKSIAEKNGLPYQDILPAIIQIPEVMQPSDDDRLEELWPDLKACLDNALAKVVEFRKTEGHVLETVFKAAVEQILKLLEAVEPLEEERIDRVRDRIKERLTNLEIKNYDKDRFEQELIFYLEKLDISEEKVRLKAHCVQFLDFLEDDTRIDKGKKMGFIVQEMGREINTLGSKANDVSIQHLVVQMKDELEKIKEQVLNTL